MTPFHTEPRFTLYVGNSLDVMPTLPPSSVDSIVSDPPYGLSFMGKDWDHGVPGEAFWREALRVAKPGAHLLAFGGTRTFHRLAVAIEDAGWEIRDCVMWVYGSGFPKSHDVAKAIDTMDNRYTLERKFKFTAWVRSQGVTARQIDDATATCMGGHYTTQATQPAIMTREHLEACRHLFADVPEWVEREVDVRTMESENMKRREVVGHRDMQDTSKIRIAAPRSAQGIDENYTREVAITAPATAEARAWEGWGTALKPAWEPVIVARKPLEGTVAENVLKYGTGAINIGECRVGNEQRVNTARHTVTRTNAYGSFKPNPATECTGRWPANVIHDGSEEVVEGFPDDNGGSAARFFYCAKAGKADRNDGCDDLPEKLGGAMSGKETRPDRPPNHTMRANHHPTVKPTDLMRYLVRLVTPPGGVVLDPFMGSGSTGRGAMLEGCRFIGIDLSEDYATIARERIAACAAEPSLFDAVS